MIEDRKVIGTLLRVLDTEKRWITKKPYLSLDPDGYPVLLLKSRGLIEECDNPGLRLTVEGLRFYGSYFWLKKKFGAKNIKLVYTTDKNNSPRITLVLGSKPEATLYDYPLYAFQSTLEDFK